MKNKLKYLLSFIIPFIMILIIFYFKGVINNVENIYVTDLRRMHLELLMYFKNILIGKTSIQYSFFSGVGSPMISTIIFYCTSPINIFVLFFKNIENAIAFIYIVKASLAGLTTYIFLKHKYKNDNIATIVFSTSYALCSYIINYFFAICWFDSFYLVPLVMLGIERMYEEEKMNLTYIISLALAIVCNIQLGFSLCIFSVIYYIYSFNIRYNIKDNKDKFISIGIIYAVSSLCAGAISIGALLGFMSNYSNISKARNLNFGYTNDITTSNILYILKNFFILGNIKTENYFNYTEPYIYSGLLVSFYSVLYLFNANIDIKKRKHALGVLIVFILSFCIGFLNEFWHMSPPVGFSFRYTFCLSIFLTMIAYECYINKEKIIKKDIVILSISFFIAVAVLTHYKESIYITPTFIILVLITTTIIFAKNKGKIYEILLFILVIIDLCLNGYYSLTTATDLSIFNYKSLKSFEQIASKKDIDPGYRVIYNYSYAEQFNDTLYLNKNSSVRFLSSVINSSLLEFLDRNKLSVGNTAYMISVYNSPLLTSLLANKYLYVQKELTEPLYNKIDTYKVKNYSYQNKKTIEENVYLYENPYSLSLGYVIEKDAKFKKGMDNVDYQNSIMKSFTGVDNVLHKLEIEKTNEEESCKQRTFKGCSVFLIKNDTDSSNIYLNGVFASLAVSSVSQLHNDIDKTALIVSKNSETYVMAQHYSDLNSKSLVAHTYNKDNLIKSLNILKENMLENIKINKNTLSAKINSNKDGILLLTIPYDNHFKIYVDKKEVEYYKVLDDTFIGLDIKKGDHNIKLVYNDNRIYLYLVSTLIAITITITIYIIINKRINKRKELEIKRIKEEELKKEAKKEQKKKKEEIQKKDSKKKKKKKK